MEFQPVNYLQDLKNSLNLNTVSESDEDTESTTSIFDSGDSEVSGEEGISAAYIDEETGHLILEYDDGTTEDLGKDCSESGDEDDYSEEEPPTLDRETVLYSLDSTVIKDDDGKTSQILYYHPDSGEVEETQTALYNENGQLAQVSIDSNNDGETDEVISIEYDENNNISEYKDLVYTDAETAGYFTDTTTDAYTRDDSGEVTEVLHGHSYYNVTEETKVVRSSDGSILIDEDNDGTYDYVKDADDDSALTGSLDEAQEYIEKFSSDEPGSIWVSHDISVGETTLEDDD